MMNTLSLSFSGDKFQLIHAEGENEDRKIISCMQYNYPQDLFFDQIFKSEHTRFVAETIQQFAKENQLDNLSILFALPFNIATIKKVAFPFDSSKEQKKAQIEWEFQTVLAGPIKEFKISVLAEKDVDSSHSQAIVVGINKKVIKELKSIAASINASLSSILLNCFAIENFIDHNQNYKNAENYVFLKVSKNFIEHHFYKGKEYFLSHIDPILLLNGRQREDVIVEITKEHYKNVENLINQTQAEQNFKLKAYGDSLSEKDMNALKKSLSFDVDYVQINEYEKDDGFKYLEAWGSLI